jgi:ubiquitin-conjugating enzyme E2 variant
VSAAHERARWLVALDWASLGLAALLASLAIARLNALPPLAWLPVLVLAAAFGWALADLASGLVHFLCDRFGSERTPLLGPAVIRPFREHHADPRAITAHGFAELSGNSALALTPLLAAGGELARGVGETLLHSAAFFGLMSASIALFVTNQVHRWAHMSNAPRFARALWRLHLAIAPEAHARHHDGAHERAFCIPPGWCNAWLDRADAWGWAERWLRGQRRRGHARRAEPGREGAA